MHLDGQHERRSRGDAGYAMAVLLAGLPAAPANLPFEIPDGAGALVFPTGDVNAPEVFHEPFTDTDSWILLETTQRVPVAGTYWLVGFDPAITVGVWVGLDEKKPLGKSETGAVAALPMPVKK